MLRTRPAAPRAAAPPGSPRPGGGGRVALALLLTGALAPGSARASGPAGAEELSEGTGSTEMSAGTGDEAARWTAQAQQRQAQGDLDGAIAGWQRAMAVLPATQATAHRRAGLALAIAGAHAQQAERGVPGRLTAAIAVLDAYLAGLDPTDDEHRRAVEQRRAELAALVAPPRPTASLPVSTPTRTREPDRRLMIAGGAALGLSVAAGATLAASLLAGTRADQALAVAVAQPGDDPRREASKAEALADGLRANRSAIVSAAVGGGLLLLGVTLLAVGATRDRPRSAWAPRMAASGLRWRF